MSRTVLYFFLLLYLTLPCMAVFAVWQNQLILGPVALLTVIVAGSVLSMFTALAVWLRLGKR